MWKSVGLGQDLLILKSMLVSTIIQGIHLEMYVTYGPDKGF